MKRNKLKFGLLGLGAVIENRVKNIFLKELKEKVEITSVFDINKSKTKKYSKIFKCKTVDSYNIFLKQNFDICYISTDSGSHFQNILDCFKNNKHVVVEKPPVLKVSELIFLNKFSKKKKLHFFVIYQNRENKAVKFVKQNLIKKNNKIVFSSLKLLWSRPQKYYRGWHGKWKTDGGVIAQQGIHYIDLLCHFFGKPIKALGSMSNISNKLQAEDTHIGLINFSGAKSTFSLTTALRPKDYSCTIEIYQVDRIVRLKGLCCNEIQIINYDGSERNKNKIISKKFSEKVPNGIGLSHYIFFKKISNFLLNKSKQIPLRAIDTIDTLKLINMIYRSSETKSWVANKNKNIKSKLGN